jgi:hypothetical protein
MNSSLNFYNRTSRKLLSVLNYRPYAHRGVLRFAYLFMEKVSLDALPTSVVFSNDKEVIFYWIAAKNSVELDIEYSLEEKQYLYYLYAKIKEEEYENYGVLNSDNVDDVFSIAARKVDDITAYADNVAPGWREKYAKEQGVVS